MEPLGAAALPRFLARHAAGAAAGCAAVHGLALGTAPHGGATVLLVAACLLCARHLYRRPSPAAWALHVVLTTAMLVLHPPLATAHHVATGPAAWAGPVAGVLAGAALLLAAIRGATAVRGQSSGSRTGASSSNRSPGPGLSGWVRPPRWWTTPHTALSAVCTAPSAQPAVQEMSSPARNRPR
jgi:hypothetical protein